MAESLLYHCKLQLYSQFHVQAIHIHKKGMFQLGGRVLTELETRPNLHIRLQETPVSNSAHTRAEKPQSGGDEERVGFFMTL